MAMNVKTETAFSGTPTAAQAPLRPEEIAPNFPQLEILECLGRGGMGVVYRARQKTLNRVVALKLLAPERVGDRKFSERFAREAQALAALNHPNIVTIYDFGQAGGFYFLLMEFVDGVNLRHLLRTRKFTPEEALAVVPPLCDALQFAHERGIVHRDIKPENILLDKSGRVKVADFGIAKMLGNSDGERAGGGVAPENVTQAALGTPGYIAPEQAANPQRVDSRADIYSLGVVFYEMLTGELPGKVIQAPSRKVQIDVRLDEIVLRALEQQPELRYQEASVLKTQVETIAQTPPHERGGGGSAPAGEQAPGAVVYGRKERKVVKDSHYEIGTVLAVVGIVFLFFGSVGFWLGLVLICMGEGLKYKLVCSVCGEPTKGEGMICAACGAHLNRQFSPKAFRAALALAASTSFFLDVLLRSGQYAIWIRSKYCWLVILVGVVLAVYGSFGGWSAMAQIRRAGGRFYGLWLAVLSALLFPLLALDAAIFGLVALSVSGVAKLAHFDGPGLVTLVGTVLSLLADGLILWRVWRAAKQPQLADSGRAADGGSSGKQAATEPAGPAPGVLDLFSVGPLASPEVREISAHMTKAERNEASFYGLLVGLWVVAATFGNFWLIRSFPAPGNWIVAGVIGLLFLVSLPLAFRVQRRFFCSTLWAKAQGYDADTLKLFSFSRNNVAGVILVLAIGCLFIVGQSKLFDHLGGARELVPYPSQKTQGRLVLGHWLSGHFIARLSQAEIELLAIKEGASNNGVWWTNGACWSPDGRPSANSFPMGVRLEVAGATHDMTERQIAFRIHDAGTNGQLSWPICHANLAGTMFGQSSLGQSGDQVFVVATASPPYAKSMDVSLGIANGAWETAFELDKDEPIRKGQWSAAASVVPGPGPDEVTVHSTYGWEGDWATRLAYVMDDGKVIPANSDTNTLSGGHSAEVTGVLPVAQYNHLRKFQLQRRPYQFAEFRNVSLQPGLQP